MTKRIVGCVAFAMFLSSGTAANARGRTAVQMFSSARPTRSGPTETLRLGKQTIDVRWPNSRWGQEMAQLELPKGFRNPRLVGGARQLERLVAQYPKQGRMYEKYRNLFDAKAFAALTSGKKQVPKTAYDRQNKPANAAWFRQVRFDHKEDARLKATYGKKKRDAHAYLPGVLSKNGRTITVRAWYNARGDFVRLQAWTSEKGNSKAGGRVLDLPASRKIIPIDPEGGIKSMGWQLMDRIQYKLGGV